MLVAAFNTNRQFEHSTKWLSMSRDTDGASFPSKYQQIKWIVSRQLMLTNPQQTLRRSNELDAIECRSLAKKPNVQSDS